MAYPVRRGSRVKSSGTGTSLSVLLPAHQAGDLLLVWLSSVGPTTLTKSGNWTMLMSGSNPGSGTAGMTGAIFAIIATDNATTLTVGSSASTTHAYIAEAVTNHKLTSTSDIKLTGTAAGNITGSGNHTYSAFGSGTLVSTDEYLMYGMIAGRDGDGAPTAVSVNWTDRDTGMSGTAATDAFVSTQSRQVTGQTALAINSHAAIAAMGYWASATIAIPGGTTSTPKQGTASGTVNFAGTVVGARPALPTKQGSASGTVDFAGVVVGSRPVVGQKQGSASGTVNFSGIATGMRRPKGAASGTADFAGQAVGARPGVITPPTGTTIPTQAEMPADPFALATEPTYAFAASSGPMASPYQWMDPTDSRIKLTGHAAKGTIAGSNSGFIVPNPLQDISGAGTGTNPLVYPPYGIRTRTNSPNVYIRVGQRSYAGFSNVSGRAAIRVKLDGKWTTTEARYLGSTVGFPSNPESITPGEYILKLTFPSAAMRTIELNTHLEFGGIGVDAGATIETAPASQHRVAIIDGSLTGAEKHQTGNFALTGGAGGTYTAVTAHIWAMAQVLGYDDVVNSATGSSGFSISGDTVSYKASTKVPKDMVEHAPNLAIIGGANNDYGAGQSTAQVSAAADTVYASVANALPNAIKVAIGMFTAPAMGSQSTVEANVAPYNDVLKAKAQQYGFWFINPTTGQTYDPQGVLRKTTSNWVYQSLSDISSDGVHPTQGGANNLGVKMAEAVRMAHPAGATTPVKTPLVADRGALSWTQKSRGALPRTSKYRGADANIGSW